MSAEKFVILGKLSPNEWRPLGEIYMEFNGMNFAFDSYEGANITLCDMKNYLKTHKKKEKVPLTIRAMSAEDFEFLCIQKPQA